MNVGNILFAFCLLSWVTGNIVRHSREPLRVRQSQKFSKGLPLTFNITKRNKVFDPATYRQINQRLVQLFGAMCSFIHERGFEEARFLDQAERICRDLAEIGSFIEEKGSSELELLARHKFSTEIFHEMLGSVNRKKNYTGKGVHLRIMRRLVQLNLIIIKLHNSHGHIDFVFDSCDIRLYRISQILNSWTSVFENLSNVPKHVRTAFERECERARNRLRLLISDCFNRDYYEDLWTIR